MRTQSIINAPRVQKQTFGTVLRVENGYARIVPVADIDNAHDNGPTRDLFKQLSKEKKHTVAIIDAPTIYKADLILMDGKDDIDASSYRNFETNWDSKIRKSPDEPLTDARYDKILRDVSMQHIRKNSMYEKYLKKAIVITMEQYKEIMKKGFDAVAEKLKIKR